MLLASHRKAAGHPRTAPNGAGARYENHPGVTWLECLFFVTLSFLQELTQLPMHVCLALRSIFHHRPPPPPPPEAPQGVAVHEDCLWQSRVFVCLFLNLITPEIKTT